MDHVSFFVWFFNIASVLLRLFLRLFSFPSSRLLLSPTGTPRCNCNVTRTLRTSRCILILIYICFSTFTYRAHWTRPNSTPRRSETSSSALSSASVPPEPSSLVPQLSWLASPTLSLSTLSTVCVLQVCKLSLLSPLPSKLAIMTLVWQWVSST